MQTHRDEIKKLVADGKLSDALNLGIKSEYDELIKDKLVHLKGRLKTVDDAFRIGIIERSNYDLNRNQISHSLLELTNEKSDTRKENSQKKQNKVYNTKVAPDFGKPSMSKETGRSFSYLFSVPAGHFNLNEVQTSNYSIVSEVMWHSHSDENPYLLTGSKNKGPCRIWDGKTSELIQEINSHEGLRLPMFYSHDIWVISGKNKLIRFDKDLSSENPFGIEWKRAKEYIVKSNDKLKEPRIEQIIGGKNEPYVYLLVKDASEDSSNMSGLNRKCYIFRTEYYMDDLEEYHSYSYDIDRMKHLFPNMIAAISSHNRKIFIKSEEIEGDDIALLQNDLEFISLNNSIKGFIQYFGLRVDFLNKSISKGNKEKYHPFVNEWREYPWGGLSSLKLIEGGYEVHNLIATSNGSKVIVANPSVREHWSDYRPKTKVFNDNSNGGIIKLNWIGYKGMRLWSRSLVDKIIPSVTEYNKYPARYLVSATSQGSIKIWDVEEEILLGEFHNCHKNYPAFTKSFSGGKFAFADKYGFIHIFNFNEK